MEFNDVKVLDDDERYSDKDLQNEIRKDVLNRRITLALKKLNDLINAHQKLTLQDYLAKKLMTQAINKEKNSKRILLQLIESEDYLSIINYLENESKNQFLNITDSYILELSKVILKIKETGIYPKSKTYTTCNFFRAIDVYDYKLALELCIEHNIKFNKNNDKDPLYILLRRICLLIKKIEEKNSEETMQEEKINISIIHKYLLNNNIDMSITILHKYLKSINKGEYEFLIANLIKLSILECDTLFTRPIQVLTLISKDNYIFNVANYIQDFYFAVSQNKFKEARIYLDIVSKANVLGIDDINTESMQNILIFTEQIQKEKRDNEIPSRSDIETETISHDNINKTDMNFNNEREFLEEYYEKLVKKGIILLNPMDENKINDIIRIVKEYNDIDCFVIENGQDKQLVLRLKPIIEVKYNVKELINKGNDAYVNKNYDECLNNYLILLGYLPEPKAFIYRKIGLCYFKKYKRYDAITYLTIANYLSKKEGHDYKLDDLLLKLKKEIPKEEYKPYFKVSEKFFEEKEEINFYGIDFISFHNYLMENELDVETACQLLNYSKKKELLIKLIYAKLFYVYGYFEQGDLFLKVVEQDKEKTPYILGILKNIRNKRKFYQNKVLDDSIELKLSLKPRK